MKLLSILNLSNKEKPGCDSGVIFHRLLFSRLSVAGWDCAIASPLALQIPGIRDLPFEVGSSKYDVRFRFDWDEAASLLERERPDVLFVHQVELVSNYRALLETLSLSPKLVTYCHYWPVLKTQPLEWDPSLNHAGLASVIMMRVMEAACTADIFFVTSKWAKGMLRWGAQQFGNSVDFSRVHILPCPADPEFLTEAPRVRIGSRAVLYNHRLYKQYGTEFFLELASDMAADQVTFVVTDFFSARNPLRTTLDPFVERYREALMCMPNVVFRDDGDLRNVYRDEIIGGVDVALAPYRENANWSMSAVDCMGMGVPVACPAVGAFPEFAPLSMQFRTKAEAISLLNQLLLNNDSWSSASREAQSRARVFSADQASDLFLRAVGSSQ